MDPEPEPDIKLTPEEEAQVELFRLLFLVYDPGTNKFSLYQQVPILIDHHRNQAYEALLRNRIFLRDACAAYNCKFFVLFAATEDPKLLPREIVRVLDNLPDVEPVSGGLELPRRFKEWFKTPDQPHVFWSLAPEGLLTDSPFPLAFKSFEGSFVDRVSNIFRSVKLRPLRITALPYSTSRAFLTNLENITTKYMDARQALHRDIVHLLKEAQGKVFDPEIAKHLVGKLHALCQMSATVLEFKKIPIHLRFQSGSLQAREAKGERAILFSGKEFPPLTVA